jgi:hypothetical protein
VTWQEIPPSPPPLLTKGWGTKQILKAKQRYHWVREIISRWWLPADQSTTERVTEFIYLLVNKGFPHLFIYPFPPLFCYIVGNPPGDLSCSLSRRQLEGKHASPGWYARPTERQCSRRMRSRSFSKDAKSLLFHTVKLRVHSSCAHTQGTSARSFPAIIVFPQDRVSQDLQKHRAGASGCLS